MHRSLELVLVAAVASAYCVLAQSSSRADLFAVGTSVGELHRIDSVSGQLLKTYAIPTGYIGLTYHSGLAFDGRIIYLSRNDGVLIQILRFDVLHETWLEPKVISPFPGVDSLAGLGILRQAGRPTLIGMPWMNTSPNPLEVVQIDLLGNFGSTFPFASLPSDRTGWGLDIDPDTGEIWVATSFDGRLDQFLVKLNSAGNIIGELPFVISPRDRMVRGLGFDNGRLFVADPLGTIFEIDRHDGSIIRSFELSVVGFTGGLTGGKVVPEPSTVALALVAATLVSVSRRRRRA